MTAQDITQLHRAIGQLRQCVGAIRSHYGDSTGVRRLCNDIDRLDIDAEDVVGEHSIRGSRPRADADVVVVSDIPYDPNLFRGVDDEGVGGYHQHG